MKCRSCCKIFLFSPNGVGLLFVGWMHPFFTVHFVLLVSGLYYASLSLSVVAQVGAVWYVPYGQGNVSIMNPHWADRVKSKYLMYGNNNTLVSRARRKQWNFDIPKLMDHFKWHQMLHQQPSWCSLYPQTMTVLAVYNLINTNGIRSAGPRKVADHSLKICLYS